MERDILLLFIEPSCSSCTALTSAIRPLIHEYDSVVLWAMVALGNQEACRKFRSENGLDCLLFAYAPEMRDQYRIYTAPYALVIDKNGIVRSKGVVNHIEHLESLLFMRDREHDAATRGLMATGASSHATSVDNRN